MSMTPNTDQTLNQLPPYKRQYLERYRQVARRLVRAVQDGRLTPKKEKNG